MRLWPNELIPLLPRNQLLGQWRELNSIYKLENRHILINFVYDYSKHHLFYYSNLVIDEMRARNYRLNLDNYNNYFNEDYSNNPLSISEIFSEKMTDHYMKQCLYNLQEKYDCGGITEEEWQAILDKFTHLII